MKVKIKNIQLNDVINLLYGLKLKSKQSRHRTRFLSLLTEQLRQVLAEEKEIAKQYCHLDGDGEPKKREDGRRWDVKEDSVTAFDNDRRELYLEEFVIDGANYQETLKVIRKILDEMDLELDGHLAQVYFEICEEFGVDNMDDDDDEN